MIYKRIKTIWGHVLESPHCQAMLTSLFPFSFPMPILLVLIVSALWKKGHLVHFYSSSRPGIVPWILFALSKSWLSRWNWRSQSSILAFSKSGVELGHRCWNAGGNSHYLSFGDFQTGSLESGESLKRGRARVQALIIDQIENKEADSLDHLADEGHLGWWGRLWSMAHHLEFHDSYRVDSNVSSSPFASLAFNCFCLYFSLSMCLTINMLWRCLGQLLSIMNTLPHLGPSKSKRHPIIFFDLTVDLGLISVAKVYKTLTLVRMKQQFVAGF